MKRNNQINTRWMNKWIQQQVNEKHINQKRSEGRIKVLNKYRNSNK